MLSEEAGLGAMVDTVMLKPSSYIYATKDKRNIHHQHVCYIEGDYVVDEETKALVGIYLGITSGYIDIAQT